ncbi:uncharacterized protein LOC114355031 [Ostrinia furnacalis]|uniref:uncharacterized protein LOC114355031 n=1 Tax=Ostrinia furnacalis TaxID=93504 RepID=UPI001039A15C|nr:uncharacterized protein LOC114355031 [Ostrinia furnacalis]
MAKLIFLIICVWILNAASTFPTVVDELSENKQTKYDLKEYGSVNSEYIETVTNELKGVKIDQQHRFRRIKRSLINGGGACPEGMVWKPRPFYCITCEEFERLSGEGCYDDE